MPPQSPTPAPAVLASLITALTGDGVLQGILAAPGVYSGRAPNGSAMPYVVIDDMEVGQLPTFDGKSGQGRFRLKLWASDAMTVLTIYGRLEAMLARRKLALAGGFEMMNASTEMITSFPDPSDTTAQQGVVNYEWAAQVL
jgi:hypothetical protein